MKRIFVSVFSWLSKVKLKRTNMNIRWIFVVFFVILPYIKKCSSVNSDSKTEVLKDFVKNLSWDGVKSTLFRRNGQNEKQQPNESEAPTSKQPMVPVRLEIPENVLKSLDLV